MASNTFKNAVKAPAKELAVTLKFAGDSTHAPLELTESDDLQSLQVKAEADLCKTVLRQAKVSYLGNYGFLLGKYVDLKIGVVLDDASKEYIDLGRFKVIKEEKKEGSEVTEITLFDKMYEALQLYTGFDPVYDGLTFPCTLKDFLTALCGKLGWSLKTDTFTNDTKIMAKDYFMGLGLTYRDVLEDIAEATGTIIRFTRGASEDEGIGNRLELVTVPKTGAVESLDKDLLLSYKLEPKYGPINSFVYSRTPQEDNIVEKDEESINVDGLTELKIENNLLVDDARASYITPVFNVLKGLFFYPFEVTTSGLFYLDIGERVELINPAGDVKESIILGCEISIGEGGGGFIEKLYTKKPVATTTNYKTAGIIGKKIQNTEIKVNKQEGNIDILTENLTGSLSQISLTLESITSAVNQAISLGDNNTALINQLQQNVTVLQQTAQSLELAVKSVGGVNLFKNSVGLKGDIKDWQEFADEARTILLDTRNNAAIVNDSEIQINSEAGSGFRLQNQFIAQTVNVILGEVYTVYFRYKTTADAVLNITGVGDVTIPVKSGWDYFKYQFTANAPTVRIKIENGSGVTSFFTDLVVKKGDASGWVQAPNEAYGKNFRFDKDGFVISSLTDSFKSVLDNTKLAVYETITDKLIMLVSKDKGKITNLTAQEEFVIQRYENQSKSLRFIPTSNGVMVVVND